MNPIRILIVEDNRERIDLFTQWLPADVIAVFAKSAGRAMRIIELDPGAVYAGIALDHDLFEQAISDEEYRFSGVDVARKIIGKVSIEVPILIHSMNWRGASAMSKLLTSAGFAVTRSPFSDLTERRFLAWLDDVRAEYTYRNL